MSAATTKKILLALVLVGFALRLAAVLPYDLRTSIDAKKMLIDDSFYSLAIARNLAAGKGPTSDGVHLTNGFQPGFVLLAAPLYALGEAVGDDHDLPVYLVQILLAALNALAALWAFGLARHLSGSVRLALFVAAAWALWPNGIRVGVNGLETSLSTFFVGWTAWYYLTRVRIPGGLTNGRLLRLGLLLGFSFWARMDTVLLALPVGLDLVLRRDGAPWLAGLRRGLLPALVSAAVFAPWFVLSGLWTGDVFPVSGRAVHLVAEVLYPPPWHDLPFENSQMAFAALLESPLLPDWRAVTLPGLLEKAPDWRLLPVTLERTLWSNGLPMLALGLLLLWRRRPAIRELGRRYGVLLGYVGLLFLVYTQIVYGSFYYFRYFYPVVLVLLPLFAWAVTAIGTERGKRLAVGLATLVFLVNAGLQARSFVTEDHSGQYLKFLGHPEMTGTVGAFQSGTLSYFRREAPVVNLDGVVNRDAYEAVRERRLCAYLRAEGIHKVVDAAEILRQFLWHDDPPCRDWEVIDSLGPLQLIRIPD